MSRRPNETEFEAHFAQQMVAMGYLQRNPEDYDRKDALLKFDLIDYLKDTQLDEYNKLIEETGSEEMAQRSLFARIRTELKKGTLHVLRTEEFEAGFGCRFRLLGRIPGNELSPESNMFYTKNRVSFVRQLRYSVREEHAANEIDLVIFVNGFPIATIELKNKQTGQTYINAIKQYMTDRRADGEPLLAFKRCMVHFAMGTEQVFMTTKLDGENTRFFPFNMTYQNEGVRSPLGNPYRTSYMWEEVLQKDSLLELVMSYANTQIISEPVYDSRLNKIVNKETEVLIFPRFHQRRAVRNLVADIKQRGAGHKYLIQHSAGSGKSNTIAWLAYALSGLFQTPQDAKGLFDSIIVVTDRRILDRQLQNTLRQFDQYQQLVCIDSHKGMTSKHLKEAIENNKKIIVTTLQKFSVIAEEIAHFSDRKFAVLIDEAHSSQTGEAARDLRKSLSLEEAERFDHVLSNGADMLDEVTDYIERQDRLIDQRVSTEIRRSTSKRHISFFAFTATPKQKTIELFCEKKDGEYKPFDNYTMEQAIQEGFICDVLSNYTSFKRYFKLVHRNGVEDKEYERQKTVRLLANYVDLQDSAIERKARIMIEDFVANTEFKIQGRARAMVVTRSRLHVVRYKRWFDAIMQEMNLPYKALCAFTGTVHDPDTGLDYTENSMNDLTGVTDIALAFKLPQYRILIVAEKYQTGFDEPMLHTMYVDKKLGDISAVQTLSRLNRTCKGKDGTSVLDFVNDPKDIQDAFQNYYGKNFIPEDEATDPNSLYDVKSKIESFQAFTKESVNQFARIYFDPKCDIAEVYPVLNEVCDNVRHSLSGDQMHAFRKSCEQFVKLYRFMFQIITFKDVELEKLYVFLAALVKQLPYDTVDIPYEVLKEAALDSYKVQYQFTTNLSLTTGDAAMTGMKPGNTSGKGTDELEWLSQIIKTLNDEFGIDLTEQDKVDLQMLRGRIYSNAELMGYFNDANSKDNIQDKFFEEVDNELLEFINGKLELYNKLTDDQVNQRFKRAWFKDLYGRLVSGIK